MFVDASALTAMLVDERDARELLARLQNSTIRITSPLAIWETVLAVARILGLDIKAANTAVEEFLVVAGINVEPVPADARRRQSRRLIALVKGGIEQHLISGLFRLRMRQASRPPSTL